MIGVVYADNLMLKIGLIGYGNHSKKLLNIISNIKIKKEIIFYNYKKNKSVEKNKFFFLKTNTIDDLLSLDAIIIVSPNQTHFKYLKFFLKKNFKGYIFCEKPISETKNKLKQIEKDLINNYKKVFINFNQRYNPITQCLKKILSNPKSGKAIYVNLSISQGLAFTEKYKKNWRSKQKKNTIILNKSIHYIDLLIYLFGKPVKIKNNLSNQAQTAKPFDTNILQLEFKNKILANIFISYSTPLNYEMQFILTNSIINLRDEKLTIIHPRDNFNKQGYFKRPKEKILLKKGDHYTKSLENSLKFFLLTANQKKFFEKKDIIKSLNSNNICFDI